MGINLLFCFQGKTSSEWTWNRLSAMNPAELHWNSGTASYCKYWILNFKCSLMYHFLHTYSWGRYLHNYDLVLCVKMGYQAICTHFTHKSMFCFFFFIQKCKYDYTDKKRTKINNHTHTKNPLKMFVYLESSLHYFSLFASTFFSLHLSPTVSRMQFQHWLFLSGLKHLNTNYLHSKPWSLFSRPQKCQERQNFLSFIFTHMH